MRHSLLLLLLLATLRPAFAGSGTEPVRFRLARSRVLVPSGEAVDLALVPGLLWRADGSIERVQPGWSILEGPGELANGRFKAPATWHRNEFILLRAAFKTDGEAFNDELYVRVYADRVPDRERLKWSAPLDGQVKTASPAVASDGTVYMGGGPGGRTLAAFTPDGKLKWKTDLGGGLPGRPAIAPDGTILVQTDRPARLFAISPDGAPRWKADLPVSEYGGRDLTGSPAAAADGTVYAGSTDDFLHAFGPDGRSKWRFKAGGAIDATTPAIGPDGTVYFGSYDGCLYAVTPAGQLKWKIESEPWLNCLRPFDAAPLVTRSGLVVCGADDGIVRAVRPDGTVAWIFRTTGYVRTRPAEGPGGRLYVASFDRNLYCLGPDGALRWKYEAEQSLGGSPAVGPDGTVYVGSDDGLVNAVSPEGKRLWLYRPDEAVESSPALSPDGSTLYVGANDNRLHALAAGAAPSGFDWDKFIPKK